MSRIYLGFWSAVGIVGGAGLLGWIIGAYLPVV